MKKKPSVSPSRDFDSPTHPPDSFHSPLRSELGDSADTPPYASPAASPHHPPPPRPAVDEFARFSPLPSPLPGSQRPLPRQPSEEERELAGGAGSSAEEGSDASLPTVVVSRAMRGEGMAPATRVGVGGAGPRAPPVLRMRRRPPALERLKRAGLCFRILEVMLCMISFSVMAADKTKGWSGDSYDRYQEYRYCLSVNVIAFVYASFQASDLAFRWRTGDFIIHYQIHYYFDFFIDQILAYLLISASSSAATRTDDWKANWGRDKFTDMADASVAISFLAFMIFAINSLVSGYNLCCHWL